MFRPQDHVRFGYLAPLGIRDAYHRHLQHRRVVVQDPLHLDAGDVLTAREDDVLLPIPQLDVAVRVNHRQVSRVEPPTPEGFSGCPGIPVVPAQDVIAPHHHLSRGLAVGRDVLHVLVHHPELGCMHVADALASQPPCSLFRGKCFPVGLPDADGVRTVRFGEAVDVHPPGPHGFHGFQDSGGRRASRCQDGEGTRQVGGPHCRHRVGEVPTVAVEHGQRPEVPAAWPQTCFDHLAEGMEGAAPVGHHHPFGPTRGTAGVVDAEDLFLLREGGRERVRAALRQERLVGNSCQSPGNLRAYRPVARTQVNPQHQRS